MMWKNSLPSCVLSLYQKRWPHTFHRVANLFCVIGLNLPYLLENKSTVLLTFAHKNQSFVLDTFARKTNIIFWLKEKGTISFGVSTSYGKNVKQLKYCQIKHNIRLILWLRLKRNDHHTVTWSAVICCCTILWMSQFFFLLSQIFK